MWWWHISCSVLHRIVVDGNWMLTSVYGEFYLSSTRHLGKTERWRYRSREPTGSGLDAHGSRIDGHFHTGVRRPQRRTQAPSRQGQVAGPGGLHPPTGDHDGCRVAARADADRFGRAD